MTQKHSYKSTEFIATAAFMLYTTLGGNAATTADITAQSATWIDSLMAMIQGGGGDLKLIIMGAVVFAYTRYRSSVKKTQIVADLKRDQTVIMNEPPKPAPKKVVI